MPKQDVRLDDIIELGHLASRLGMTAKTVRNRVSSGSMPVPFKIPRTNQLFFLRSEIDAWLSKNLTRRPLPGDDPRGGSARRGRKTKEQAVFERRAGGMV